MITFAFNMSRTEQYNALFQSVSLVGSTFYDTVGLIRCPPLTSIYLYIFVGIFKAEHQVNIIILCLLYINLSLQWVLCTTGFKKCNIFTVLLQQQTIWLLPCHQSNVPKLGVRKSKCWFLNPRKLNMYCTEQVIINDTLWTRQSH